MSLNTCYSSWMFSTQSGSFMPCAEDQLNTAVNFFFWKKQYVQKTMQCTVCTSTMRRGEGTHQHNIISNAACSLCWRPRPAATRLKSRGTLGQPCPVLPPRPLDPYKQYWSRNLGGRLQWGTLPLFPYTLVHVPVNAAEFGVQTVYQPLV